MTPELEEVRKTDGNAKIDHVRAMLSMDRISRLWEENRAEMDRGGCPEGL